MPDAFDKTLSLLMARAFDLAWERLSTGARADQRDELNIILARHIVSMVQLGERDLERLTRGAVVKLRLAISCLSQPQSSKRQTRRENRRQRKWRQPVKSVDHRSERD